LLLESRCVFVALIENYSTSKPLKASPEKSEILIYDTLVANERYPYQEGREMFRRVLHLKLSYKLVNILMCY